MKVIYIMRHASAENNEGEGDHARKLSKKGIKECKYVGDYMKENQLLPEHVLCSSAKRTTQTAEEVTKCLPGNIPIEPMKVLYNSTPGDMIKQINATDEKINSIMIVAHNPGVHQACLLLARHITPQAMNHLQEGCPPGSLAAFTIEGNWQSVEPHMANLQEFITPELIKDSA